MAAVNIVYAQTWSIEVSRDCVVGSYGRVLKARDFNKLSSYM